MNQTLLLITGAGRSGTSTAAGALHHLGLHVPGPYLKANKSNPRGFYESLWSVHFHNALLRRAGLSIADGRPEASELMRTAWRDADRTELADWLAENVAGHPVTVVKDPRTAWTLELWSRVAEKLGLKLVHLVMLRHPAEVLGSRATHYAAGIETMGEAGFAVKNLAGWVNAMTMAERTSRGRRRTFIRYDDLLADWRTAMDRIALDLDIDLDTEPDAARNFGETHPVDEFIDPTLSRHQITFADLDLPPGLEAVAAQVWQSCGRLADHHGADPAAEAELDAASAQYSAMYSAAQQLTHDATAAKVHAARTEAAETAPAEKAAGTGQAGERRVLLNSLRRRFTR